MSNLINGLIIIRNVSSHVGGRNILFHYAYAHRRIVTEYVELGILGTAESLSLFMIDESSSLVDEAHRMKFRSNVAKQLYFGWIS